MLRELYQETIVDHNKHPRNYGALPDASHKKEGFNPLCGDKLTLFLLDNAGTIDKLHFEGCGCAISIASASLMTEALQGKTREEIITIFNEFHHLVTTGDVASSNHLGKLTVFSGVAEYPARVKCATLAWHTLKALLENDNSPVSTE